jgi:hypothetical protein
MVDIAKRLPGSTVTHNASDSILINWNGLICGARFQPRSNHWLVVIHDVRGCDLDTAEVLESVAYSRDEAIEETCRLAQAVVDESGA